MNWVSADYSCDELLEGSRPTALFNSLHLPRAFALSLGFARVYRAFGEVARPGAEGDLAWQFAASGRLGTVRIVRIVRLPWNLNRLRGDERLEAIYQVLDAPPDMGGIRVAVALELVHLARHEGSRDLEDVMAYARAAGACLPK